MSSQLSLPPSVVPSNGYAPRGPDLPRAYGITRLVLMPRDPHWLHAYWEVAPYTWRELERDHGGAARSARPVLRLHASREGGGETLDVDVHLDARAWYVFSPARGGSWVGELGLLLPDGRFLLLARSNEIQLPAGEVSALTDEKWGMLKGEWERLYELSGGGRLGAGSMDVARMQALRWELFRAVSSWPGSSWARPAAPAPGAKKFWMVADCELLVYGATEPDARVTVRGEPVDLNPDGTFALRFPLPDGRLDIPIRADNADGDLSESARFAVDRRTRRGAEDSAPPREGA
jgi:uncharacterized protein